MSLYQDIQYLLMIANKLKLFKKVNNNLWTCRCPVCGDSKKDKTKTRGYFYQGKNKQGLVYYCQNCQANFSFSNFLKQFDENLYHQYIFECLKESNNTNLNHETQEQLQQKLVSHKTISTSQNIVDSVLDSCTRVDKLPDNHPCKQYCISRKLIDDKMQLLYYTSDFKQFVNNIIPGKFKPSKYKEPRLVIPYFDKHGRVFALQGRSLDPTAMIRYYSIKIDNDIPMVYGLDRVKFDQQIYVTEGPIDSLFLPNCLAVSGANYKDSVIEQLKNNVIIVPDNERRNKQVCNQVNQMLSTGFKVCLWPDGLDFKDINEGILNGYTQQQLVEIINNNVISGLTGQVRYKLWRKC